MRPWPRVRDGRLGMNCVHQKRRKRAHYQHSDTARSCTQSFADLPLADLPFDGLRLHHHHKF